MTVYLFDNNKELIGEIVPLDYTQKTILGGTITASITAIYSPEIETAHYFGSKDIDDENTFHLYRVTSKKKRNGLLELSAIHILFEELQGHVIRDIRPSSVTPAVALDRILENTDWQVGIQSATGTASSTYYYQSTLSAFWDFIKTWRVEFKPRLVFTNGVITGRFIDIYNNMSANYGKWYEYGDKLITVEAKQANEGIFTALVGLGKGEETGDGFGRKINFSDVAWSVVNGDPIDKPVGQDYIELPNATAIYGFREAVVEFPEIEDRTELLQATYLELLNVSRPKVEFLASAIETEQIELGETVTVIRDDLGIRYQTRVFELTRNFLNKTVKSFRFGDRIITSSAERIRNDREKTENKIKEQQSLLESVRDQIKDAYWNEDGYNYELTADNEYGLPAGYYSFDRLIDQDPTKVIYVGAGKMLISNSKNPNGEWIWQTAATPEGLVGESIIANSITANQLSADVGQSLDLSSNVAITSKVSETTFNQVTGQLETNVGTLDVRATNVEAAINGAKHTFNQDGYEFRDVNSQIMFSLTKGMANEQNITKHDDCENGYPLIIPVHIGSSTASIDEVKVKWKNSPYRSTAKSAASGGGSTSGASSSSTTSSGGGHTSGSGGGATSGASSATTTSSGGSASVTSASGGGHTSGGGGETTQSSTVYAGAAKTTSAQYGHSTDHYHSYSDDNHSHNVYIPSHSHWVNNHTHSITIPAHSHNMPHTHSIPAHTHAVNDHSHSMPHTHSTPSHVHGLTFGVVEQSVSSNALTVWVDGVQRGSVNAAQGEINITAYLQTTGWHTIELRTTTLKRIDANLFIKSYIRR